MAPTLKKYIYEFKVMPEDRSSLTFSDPTKIKIYSDHYRLGVRLDGIWNKYSRKLEYPLDTDIYCEFPVWNPDAIKTLVTFEELSYSPDSSATISWRINDGTDDYYYDTGTSNWVNPTLDAHWNTEAEVSDNISTFTEAVTSKQIKFLVKLQTTDKDYTPICYGYKLMIEAQFDWFEDLIIRSVIPSIRDNFLYTKDFSTLMLTTGTTFNIQTDHGFVPEEDLNISSIDAVYDHTNDPNHTTDLFSSYNSGTGLVTLTSSINKDDRVYIRFKIEPEVSLNFTDSDYTEVGKVPAIVLDSINIKAIEVKAEESIVDKVTPKGYKMNFPLWCKELTILGVLITSKNVDAMRAISSIYTYFLGTINNQITTKALDLKLSMCIEDISRYNPRVNLDGARSSAFQISIKNFYAWLRDVEDHYVVTNFDYHLNDRPDIGPSEEFGIIGRQNAGVVKQLIMTPVIEEESKES
jgi:hypothetical protein